MRSAYRKTGFLNSAGAGRRRGTGGAAQVSGFVRGKGCAVDWRSGFGRIYRAGCDE